MCQEFVHIFQERVQAVVKNKSLPPQRIKRQLREMLDQGIPFYRGVDGFLSEEEASDMSDLVQCRIDQHQPSPVTLSSIS